MTAFIEGHMRKAKKRSAQKGRDNIREKVSGEKVMQLSIFDIPLGLLTSTQSQDVTLDQDWRPSIGGSCLIVSSATGVGEQELISGTPPSAIRGLTCRCCRLTFNDHSAQQAHFKSLLHITNLRRQLTGKAPLTNVSSVEDDFSSTPQENQGGDQQVAGEMEEVDGSSSTDSGEDLGTVAEADGDEIRQTDVLAGGLLVGNEGGRDSGLQGVRVEFSQHEGARVTFNKPDSAWAFTLSSAALGMERGCDPWEKLNVLLGEGASNRMWGVLILRSGRFAGAVFEGQSLLCHKVFRRYTIRAKRGGSQSSYDSGGRKAQSAGASLRRYGEQSLKEDVQAQLREWRGVLKACRVILTSIPKAMRSIVYDGKDPSLHKGDKRIRSVPFAVGKPTLDEVVLVHAKITSILFQETAGAGAGLSKSSEVEKARESPKRDVMMGVPEEEEALAKCSVLGAMCAGAPPIPLSPQEDLCPQSVRLLEACENGNVASVTTILDGLTLDNEGGVNVAEWARGGESESIRTGSLSRTQGTDKGESSRGGQQQPSSYKDRAKETNAVYNDHGATETLGTSPWTPTDVVNRPDGLERLMTPLHVAAAGGHVTLISVLLDRGADPGLQDVQGRVPYVLAREKEVRDAFRRARAAAPELWDWDRARVPEPLTDELEQRRKEKEREKKRRARQRKKEGKELALKQEQERKEGEEAEAARRRELKLAAAGCCDGCGECLVDKKAFSRYDFRYCSAVCIQAHKRKLAADAAERRTRNHGGT
ncbi:unnamed protein product [Choristocarpus tenellus]